MLWKWSCFLKWCWVSWIYFPPGKYKSWLLYHTIYKINCRWIVDKMWKLKHNTPRRHQVEYLNYLGKGINYLNRTQFIIRTYNTSSYRSVKEKGGKHISVDKSPVPKLHERGYPNVQYVLNIMRKMKIISPPLEWQKKKTNYYQGSGKIQSNLKFHTLYVKM